MKILKILLVLFFGVIILSAVLMIIDYYFYSWSSPMRPFGCEYKNIGVDFNSKKLKQNYDLSRIAAEIQSNPQLDFKVNFRTGSLIVSRIINNVKYNIRFQEYNTASGRFTEIIFDNFNSENYTNSISRSGEEPTTPNYYIKNNIHQMIDEMPLNDAQKNELKSKVWISCSPTAKIGF